MPIMPWKILDSRYVLRDPWMTLRADRCEMPGGLVIDPYYVQEPRDWVQAVAFDCEDRVLIVRQYRHGAGLISRELPSGTLEPGEAPVEAMRRELLEETGCTVDAIWPLQPLSPNPAILSNRIHAFVATGTRCVQEQKLDVTEDIEFEFVPIAEVLAMADAGEFPQALHIASLFLALRSRGLLRVDAEAR